MTEPHDEERQTLPALSGAVLWCLRMWVLQLGRGLDAESRIEGLLDRLGAADAAPHLKLFVAGLSTGCTRMIEVRCTCAARVAADERALLDVLSLAQAFRPFEALLLLRGLVTREAASAALRSAEEFGHALAQAGHFLPTPDHAIRHYAMAGAQDDARSPHATLH